MFTARGSKTGVAPVLRVLSKGGLRTFESLHDAHASDRLGPQHARLVFALAVLQPHLEDKTRHTPCKTSL